ncbi:MAG TPA: Ig-like domain-containing protein, partial [Pseudonocardiaceae bacterium]
EAKEAVRRDLGMTPTEYIETTDAAQAAAETGRELREQVGDAYAGSWFDPSSKKLNVAVTDEAAADAVRDAGGDAHVREVSHEELTATRDAVRRWADGLPAEQRALFHATVTDVRDGRVVVKLGDSPAARELAGQVPRDGAPVVIEHEAGQAVVTHLRGGEGIAAGPTSDPADLAGVCSLGFNAVNADGLGRALTAGHCAAGGQQYVFTEAATPTPVGVFDTHVFGEGGDDHASIRVTNPAMRLTPDVNNYNGEAVHVLGSAAPIVGMPVCKSGRTTEWSCGDVLDAEEPVRVTAPSGAVDLVVFVHDACSEPGDSGGAVLAGNNAVGITEGGRPISGTDTRCPEKVGGQNFSVAEALVTDVLPDFGSGLHLLTANGDADSDGVLDVDELSADPTTVRDANGDGVPAFRDADEPRLRAPALTSPADGRTADTTPALGGTGKPGARVAVTIGDTEPLEATVGRDGSWSVTVPAELAIGTHPVRIEHSFGETASEPVSASLHVVPPAPAISTPGPGTVSDDATPDFAGTALPGATVHLAAGALTASVTVPETGAWTLSFPSPLPAGPNTVTATQEVAGLVSDPASTTYEVRAPNVQPAPTPGDDLANTGVNAIVQLTVAGATLLLVGAAVLFVLRRRDPAAARTRR